MSAVYLSTFALRDVLNECYLVIYRVGGIVCNFEKMVSAVTRQVKEQASAWIRGLGK